MMEQVKGIKVNKERVYLSDLEEDIQKATREPLENTMQEEYDKLKIKEAQERMLDEVEHVNNPAHYQSKCKDADIDCITAMRAAYGDVETSIWCKLNAFKYLWRCENKGKMKEDLEKARWYLNKIIELT